MEKFISTLFTIIIVLWILKWVFRLVGPWLMTLLAKSLMKKAGFTPPPAADNQSADDTSRASTVKSDKWWKPDEVILKPRREQGERISDILGGEYTDCQEVDTPNANHSN